MFTKEKYLIYSAELSRWNRFRCCESVAFLLFQIIDWLQCPQSQLFERLIYRLTQVTTWMDHSTSLREQIIHRIFIYCVSLSDCESLGIFLVSSFVFAHTKCQPQFEFIILLQPITSKIDSKWIKIFAHTRINAVNLEKFPIFLFTNCGAIYWRSEDFIT